MPAKPLRRQYTLASLMLILLVVATATASAQTFTVTPNPASVEADLTTTPNPYEIVAEAMITNNTSSTLNLKWARIVNNKPDCWETAVFGVWIQSVPTIDSLEFDLGPNEDGIFNVSAFTNLMGTGYNYNAGAAEVVVKITNLNDPADTLLVEYHFLATGDINCITSTSEVGYESLQLYPNPATDSFHLSGTPDVQYLQVYSMLGEQICRYDVAPQQEYAVGDLPGGVYVVKLLDRNHEVLKTVKLVKA